MKQKQIFINFAPIPEVGGIGDCTEDHDAQKNIAIFIHVLMPALIEGDTNAIDMLVRYLQVYAAQFENKTNVLTDDEIELCNRELQVACDNSARTQMWVHKVMEDAAQEVADDLSEALYAIRQIIEGHEESKAPAKEEEPCEVPDVFSDFMKKFS